MFQWGAESLTTKIGCRGLGPEPQAGKGDVCSGWRMPLWFDVLSPVPGVIVRGTRGWAEPGLLWEVVALESGR